MNLPEQVGCVELHDPVVEEPSPVQVNWFVPTIPNPDTQVKVQLLPWLLELVQLGTFPSVGWVRDGHVIAGKRDNIQYT